MFILLPQEEGPQGFAKMVGRLSGNNLRAATFKNNLGFKLMDVQLPKFKMEVKLQESLIPVSVISRKLCYHDNFCFVIICE